LRKLVLPVSDPGYHPGLTGEISFQY